MTPALLLVLARMQKTAQDTTFTKSAVLGKLTGGLLGRTVLRPLTRPAVSAAGTATRKWSPARIAGIGLGGSAAYGHAREHADNTVGSRWFNPLTYGGKWYNPFSWGEDPSEAEKHTKQLDIFKRQNADFNAQAEGLKADYGARIQQALSRGDHGAAQQLQQEMLAKMQSGNFGGSFWSLGGLNPFAQQRASLSRHRALTAQGGVQGAYNAEMGRVGPQPGDVERLQALQERLQAGDVMPYEAKMLEEQIGALKQKVEATPGTESPYAQQLRERMQGTGMRFSPYAPQAPAPPVAPVKPTPTATPAGHLGQRPGSSHYYNPYLNAYDFRPNNSYNDLIDRPPLNNM